MAFLKKISSCKRGNMVGHQPNEPWHFSAAEIDAIMSFLFLLPPETFFSPLRRARSNEGEEENTKGFFKDQRHFPGKQHCVHTSQTPLRWMDTTHAYATGDAENASV